MELELELYLVYKTSVCNYIVHWGYYKLWNWRLED